MRYLFGFICVLALGVMGCSETAGTGGSGGEGGQGGVGGSDVPCVNNVCPCDEAGIRAAIAEGGEEPFTFDCDGPTTVVTEAGIIIDNDVILDGEGNLTVDGDDDHRVFQVLEGATTTLNGFRITGGVATGSYGGGIQNYGTLTLTNITVSGNTASCFGGGIANEGGTLVLTSSSVWGNTSEGTDGCGGAILNGGTLRMTNSTVSGNTNGGLWLIDGVATIESSTVSDSGDNILLTALTPALTFTNSLVTGCLLLTGTISSSGYNIESPYDTCGFDQPSDQVNVSADNLKLGPLRDNGGPTMTHALGAGSVAIDQIPAVDCVDADGQPLTTDQRGEPRPETGGTMCDVGSVERSARDAALASYCAAVLECFPDDESCEADFVNLLWVGSGGDFAACTSAKVELVECVASLDCDKLGGAREDYIDVVIEECPDQLGAAWQTCEVRVK